MTKTKALGPLAAALLAITVSAGNLSAQDQNRSEQRYVTLLTVRYAGGKVLVDFQPVDRESRYRVYRSERAILEEADLGQAQQTAEASAEQLPLSDTPPEDGRYYYAVTVLNGTEEVFLVPFHSTTVYPVDFAPFPEGIQGFSIVQEDSLVRIRFHPSRQEHRYNLYLGNKPMEDLSEQRPVQSMQGGEETFELSLQPETPYYFVITEQNRLGAENRQIETGRNQNEEPFYLKKKKEEPKPEKKEPRPETKPAAPAPKAPPQKKKEDFSEIISRNIRYNFLRGRYGRSLDVFQGVLRKRLTGEQRAKANFYAGQCAFYLQRYREALRCFIAAKESDLYCESAELWIDRCLERLDP